MTPTPQPQEAVSPSEGETLRVLLDNLVIAQSLSREIRQRATDEARAYLYDLRHRPKPSTREAESPVSDQLASNPGALEASVSEAVAWPVITDDWINTYCELTGRDPDGGSVTFLGDGPVSASFKDIARREIDAMLCAAPKNVFHPAPSPASAWKPIETHDGSSDPVDVLYADGRRLTDATLNGRSWGREEWRGSHTVRLVPTGKPTHWMTLPTPPATDE